MPCYTSLTLMATMIRDREVSPVELLESHLQQIERVNPKLNAFIRVLPEEARAAAKAAEKAVMRGEPLGLLHGVPVTVKDSFDMAGLPTYCGTKFRLDHRAASDSTAAARFRKAGAVILGKTSTPEFLNMYETDNHIIGRTNNPWNLAYTPGGSSGGESAALSSFCSGGGIGSDGGGSIRIPAAFCGICGLKPTPGRVSAAGHFPAISHPGGLLGVAGPMARTAQDVRLLFAALSGHDIEDPFSVPIPLSVPSIQGLKIGVWPQFYDTPVHPEVRANVETAAELLNTELADLGIVAETFAPTGLERAMNIWWFFFGQLPSRLTRQMIEGREQDAHWTGTELLNKALAEPEATVEKLLMNLAIRDRMRTALLRQMEEYRVILMPVCGVPPFPHRLRELPVGEGKTIGLLDAMTPVAIFNLLGFPGISVPFGMSSDGMPLAIQLVGRPYEEELLLELAVKFEQVRGLYPSPPLEKL